MLHHDPFKGMTRSCGRFVLLHSAVSSNYSVLCLSLFKQLTQLLFACSMSYRTFPEIPKHVQTSSLNIAGIYPKTEGGGEGGDQESSCLVWLHDLTFDSFVHARQISV